MIIGLGSNNGMQMRELITQLLIVGSGPAGYTAAIYAARANLRPIVLTGPEPGGQLTITTDVENYPGFAKPIQGPWLMEQMAIQAEQVGATYVQESALTIDLSGRPFVTITDGETRIRSDTLIVATGATAKWLGLPSESRFRGYGLSACATCDGFFFRGKRVAVIGGGNTAVEEAIYLTNHASQVTLIHRRDKLRAEEVLQERLLRHPQVDVIWNSIVEDIHGDLASVPKLSGIKLRDTTSGAVSEHAFDGVFVAIGHSPATSLFHGQLKLGPGGHILTRPGSSETSVQGVFAAGDVADDLYRQAVYAAGMGCVAALQAVTFLTSNKSVLELTANAAPLVLANAP